MMAYVVNFEDMTSRMMKKDNKKLKYYMKSYLLVQYMQVN